MWACYSLNDAPNVTVTGGTAELANLTNGEYSLTVYANDTFGVTASQTVNFTVSVPTAKPAFTSQLVAAVTVASVVIAVTCVGTVIYFRKRKH